MKRVPLFLFLVLGSLALAGPISVESGGSSSLPGIDVANGAFKVTPAGAVTLSSPLPVAGGGTGLSAGGSNGQVMVADVNGVPTWGIAAIAGGGTNMATPPIDGGIVYGASLGYASTAQGTTGQCLKSAGANAPTWGACSAADTKQGAWSGLCLGGPCTELSEGPSGMFIGPYKPTVNGGTFGEVTCSWLTPGAGGSAGVVIAIIDEVGTELCSCTLGACNTAAGVPKSCWCGTAYSLEKQYMLGLKSTTDCSAGNNPDSIMCNVEMY